MRFLVVEDEAKTAYHLQKGLAEINIVSDVARDGFAGLQLAESKSYDLIILDLMLPGLDGRDILKRLRDSGRKTPIIILTACDAVQNRVAGLQQGADDYLVKPFAFSELLARIQNILRRGRELQPSLLRVADLEVNSFGLRAVRGGKRLGLTQKEFALLSLLISRPGEVFSRSVIAEQIWNMDIDSGNVVEVHMRRLRAKVDDPFEKKLIHTVRGVGYVLEDR